MNMNNMTEAQWKDHVKTLPVAMVDFRHPHDEGMKPFKLVADCTFMAHDMNHALCQIIQYFQDLQDHEPNDMIHDGKVHVGPACS